jgi:hypothetical protein
MWKELVEEIRRKLADWRIKRQWRHIWLERYQKKHQKKKSKSSEPNQPQEICQFR